MSKTLRADHLTFELLPMNYLLPSTAGCSARPLPSVSHRFRINPQTWYDGPSITNHQSHPSRMNTKRSRGMHAQPRPNSSRSVRLVDSGFSPATLSISASRICRPGDQPPMLIEVLLCFHWRYISLFCKVSSPLARFCHENVR